jgi:Protein of unknown function (DUF2946)
MTALLVAAVLMAAQPWLSALAHVLRQASDAAAFGELIICTAHGATLLSDAADGDPGSQPDRESPAKASDCPFCALGCNGAAKVLPAATPPQQWPPVPLASAGDGQGADFLVAHRTLRLVTAPPRAPPHTA